MGRWFLVCLGALGMWALFGCTSAELARQPSAMYNPSRDPDLTGGIQTRSLQRAR